MALDPLHAFYCSKAYLDLAQYCKIKSGGVCARCGGVFDLHDLRPHHIVEVTLDNLDDANITLNANNIEVVCRACHDALHPHTFGNIIGVKHVYLVYGSPLAGKTTYVNATAERNDLVIDLDKIHRALGVCGAYDKPDAQKRISFDVRDLLLDEVRTAGTRRKWQDAYIVGTYPENYAREEMVREYGAELVHIDTPKDECIARAMRDITHEPIRAAVIGWINNYWERYSA